MIYVGNGEGLQISHIGTNNLDTQNGSLKLNNVLIVPKFKKKVDLCSTTHH